jgi:hypothetical protein
MEIDKTYGSMISIPVSQTITLPDIKLPEALGLRYLYPEMLPSSNLQNFPNIKIVKLPGDETSDK